LLFAGITLLPLLATAQAQTNVVPPRRFGVTAGLNSSTLAGDDDLYTSRRTAFIGGAFMVIPTTPTFSVQPELLFAMKGAKASEQGFTATLKLTYIEIPVLGRFDIPASGGVKPFVYAGPAISFNLSCSSAVSGPGIDASGECEDEDTGESVKKIDYSGVIGGGLAFDVSGRTFTIGARYTHGFASLADEGAIKNRTISVLASLEFPWPKK
jgi:hypothetical protein